MNAKENKTKVQESAELKTKPIMYDLGVNWQEKEEILKAFEEEIEETETSRHSVLTTYCSYV